MVHIVRLLSAAALASLTSAAPMMRRDSAIGEEVAVSAPNGVIESDTPTATSGSYQTQSSYDNSCSGGDCNQSSSSSCSGSDCNQSSTMDCSGGDCNQSSTMDCSGGDCMSSTMDCSNGDCNMSSTMDCSGGDCMSSTMDCSSGDCMSSTMDMSSSSYGYNYQQTTSMYESTSTMMSESSMMTESTSTSSAYMSYSTPSYGSGSNSWGGSGYNDCVMQCAASFGMPSATWTPPTATMDSSMYGGSSGNNGVTHTIIVAPSQGVLRYVPFSTNASVGDTVTFKWGAGPHTVTQSSGLEVCNKTDIPNAFNSGDENAGFTWNMVINDTKPIWFYCGVKTHCKQGMFGGINIGQPNPDMGNGDYVPLSSTVANMTSSDSDVMAAYQYTKSQTSKNAYANNWGMSINVAGMDDDAKKQVMMNTLWTQTLIAANPDAVDKDKGFQVTDKPLTIPMDISNAIAAAPAPSGAAAAGAAPTSAGASAASSAGAAAPTGTNAADKSGAVSVTSSSVAFAFVAIVASFMML